ncbi:MAG: M14 family zinc carboxypeptidase [Sumerlaeia bacterium]
MPPLTDTTPLGSTAPGAWELASIPGCEVEAIGASREGRALYGLRAGRGAVRVSITAGAHADEPVGPRTAVRLAVALARSEEPWARELAQACTFRLCPHVNPDGDAHNAAWQAQRGDARAYLEHVTREAPGDDVEFNYPRSADDRGTRPENLAVADFLRAEGEPYALHASLHSMGVAEGAWFLVCREWADRCRTAGMFERLANAAGRSGLGLHDMERHGEKGFHRLAPGFCTTPRSDAMRQFFLDRDDAQMAALFRPSSMEFIQSLGGDPLCLVSELPHFELTAAHGDPAPLDARPYGRLRDRLPEIKAALAAGNEKPLRDAEREFGLRPVTWETHSDLQLAFLREGLRAVRGTAA